MPVRALAYFLNSAGSPLVARDLDLPDPGPGEALVEVLACGLCHTDLAFADGSVPPKHPLPLVLGHEVVGRIVASGDASGLAGLTHTHDLVVVPAVLPCGRCAFCCAGRGNACPDQKMPGNDIHGGFATHLLVPSSALVSLDDLPATVDVREISVVADAVSTAYQAVRRAELRPGDAAMVVGAGGVGSFVVQIARALGGRVIACDVRRDRLDLVAAHGAERTVEVEGRTPQDVRKEVHGVARAWGIPSLNFRIFECSGSPQGQLLAFGLLSRAATLVQVGYTPKAVEVRLSNLMAFDATVHGTWGCPPAQYPDVLRLIGSGEVVITPFVEHAPMSRLNELLDQMAHHQLANRMILDPRQ
jgi:6-hydroxycyclohex-1-ene-1-carbonyl-CoA dehydrogenase